MSPLFRSFKVIQNQKIKLFLFLSYVFFLKVTPTLLLKDRKWIIVCVCLCVCESLPENFSFLQNYENLNIILQCLSMCIFLIFCCLFLIFTLFQVKKQQKNKKQRKNKKNNDKLQVDFFFIEIDPIQSFSFLFLFFFPIDTINCSFSFFFFGYFYMYIYKLFIYTLGRHGTFVIKGLF